MAAMTAGAGGPSGPAASPPPSTVQLQLPLDMIAARRSSGDRNRGHCSFRPSAPPLSLRCVDRGASAPGGVRRCGLDVVDDDNDDDNDNNSNSNNDDDYGYAAAETILDDTRRYRGVISKIMEGLYLTGEAGSQNEEELERLHIRRILNLAEAACADAFPNKYAYFTIDLLDDGAKEDLRSLFLEVIDWLETPAPPSDADAVLVHCHAGMSRSATFVIAYVMWKLDLGFRAAIDYVTKRRSVVSPNGGFMGQLILWEKLLRASRTTLTSTSTLSTTSSQFQQKKAIPMPTPEPTPTISSSAPLSTLSFPQPSQSPTITITAPSSSSSETAVTTAAATVSKPPAGRLLRVVVHPRSYHMQVLVGKEVSRPSAASLDTRGCFVLHVPTAHTAYCWIGRHAAQLLRDGGHNICRQLSAYLCVETVADVPEGEEPPAFWDALCAGAREAAAARLCGEVRDLDPEYVRRMGGTFRYPSWDVVSGLVFGGLYTLECHAKRQVWVKLFAPDSIAVWVPPGFTLRPASHAAGSVITDKHTIAEVVAEEFYRDMNIPYNRSYLHIADSYVSMLPENTPRPSSVSSSP